jgi:hypothetical protein
MLGAGIVRVRLVVIEPPPGLAPAERYGVQVGAFQNRDNSERLAESLRKSYPNCRLVRRDSLSPPWRALVGMEPSPEAAAELARHLRLEVGSAFVVRLDEQAADGL